MIVKFSFQGLTIYKPFQTVFIPHSSIVLTLVVIGLAIKFAPWLLPLAVIPTVIWNQKRSKRIIRRFDGETLDDDNEGTAGCPVGPIGPTHLSGSDRKQIPREE